jgi:hypothetical protein
MSSGPGRSSSPPTTAGVYSPLRLVAAICIIAPFVGVLWIPSYNKRNPTLLSFPFFYWYQLLWVVITALLMVVAFHAVKRDNAARYPESDAGSDEKVAP